MATAREVARYREGMANLMANLVETTGEIERWLDIEEVDGDEAGSLVEIWLSETQEEGASANSVLEDDPARIYQIMCVLLLHKARIHALAVLRANETDNAHSLAVQMRPILECAGQVAFIFHNLMIAPGFLMERERVASMVYGYLGADYHRTIIGATNGNVSHEELLQTIAGAAESAAMSFGMPTPKAPKGKTLRQADKVAMLPGGNNWYDHLSKYFCHGEANWTGPSWQGGVGAMDVNHELTCAGLMHYLAEQVALMNAYASLCPAYGDVHPSRVDAALAKLRDVQEASATLRYAALSVIKPNGAGQDRNG